MGRSYGIPCRSQLLMTMSALRTWTMFSTISWNHMLIVTTYVSSVVILDAWPPQTIRMSSQRVRTSSRLQLSTVRTRNLQREMDIRWHRPCTLMITGIMASN